MKHHPFFGLLVAIVLAVGCGQDQAIPPPSGEVYEGKHTSEWGAAVTDPDRSTRLEAAKVLAKMGKEGKNGNPAIPGLQKGLADEDAEIRGWSAVALVYAARGTLFPVGAVVGPKLEEATKSSDEELRAEAGQLLERMQQAPAGRPGRGGNGPEGEARPEEKKQAPDDGKEKNAPTPP